MSLLDSLLKEPIQPTAKFLHQGIHYQLSPDQLVQATLDRGEGELSDTGALCISTGKFTGRSPKDKFIVRDAITTDTVNWNNFNQPISEPIFLQLRDKMLSFAAERKDLWVRDVRACHHPGHTLTIRVLNENPWSNLFVSNMFLPPDYTNPEALPEWTIIQLPTFLANPELDGVPHPQFSILSFTHKMILIGGTGYTGEMKKGIFTVLNFILPLQQEVLSMHCSANKGAAGDVALFFGLSGTGKTTLSADPNRQLIGDDEHGWTTEGVFNFEGGCYAKVIDLRADKEPEIFNAIRPGALLENTCFYPDTHQVDYSNRTITENTRVSYPLNYISNACFPAMGGNPNIIFFLTCDAYGVLPPISKLNADQAMYQFISGYTAKVAGTETGVTEPVATFSACFGAPFMPLHPGVYARLLGKRIHAHDVQVWLINTGWIGGAYGTGKRIPLAYTRPMISAVYNNQLQSVPMQAHPHFGLLIPEKCADIPQEILLPWKSWNNREAYMQQSKKIATLFQQNFRQYASGVSANISEAGVIMND